MAEIDSTAVPKVYFIQVPNFDHGVCTCNGKACGFRVLCLASVETGFNLLRAMRSRWVFARLRTLFLGISRLPTDQLKLNYFGLVGLALYNKEYSPSRLPEVNKSCVLRDVLRRQRLSLWLMSRQSLH